MAIRNAEPPEREPRSVHSDPPEAHGSWCNDPERFAAVFEAEHAFVARLLRRLGVTESAVDDLLQSVFMVLASKLDSITAGSERAFLYGTAQRSCADFRRRASARYELSGSLAPDTIDPTPHADELLDQKRARQLLDRVLSEMTLELRSVFVLFELERLTMAEIAELTGLLPGTVASRLRRARAVFFERLHALEQLPAGPLRPEVEVAS
jgi:RNA polymerase sigma-70 factor (ECF subfamily)